MLVIALWLLTRAWHASILDRHEFRQLQTAVATYWMKLDGFRLDYEFPIFGPPWSVPLEFPLYQWIVATASRLLGTGLEPTARGVSVFFFFATLPAVYGLAGLLPLSPSRRLLVVSAVLASPTYLFYGRTFLIETTALCFSTWYLFLQVRAVRDDRGWLAVLAGLLAILAGLTKVTTLVVFLPPAALLTWMHWRHRWAARAPNPAAFRRSTALASVPVLVGSLVAVWWVHHSDWVKDSNPFSGFLTAREMTRWNWGTWAQRLSAETWTHNWLNVSQLVFGVSSIVLLGFCAAIVRPPYRRAAAWCVGFFLVGPVLFTNLYYRHDYYYCATALFLLMGAGFLLVGIWDAPQLPRPARLVAIGLFLGGQLALFNDGYGDYYRRGSQQPPGIATLIRELVPANDVVVIYGWDWNTLVPYYAQRRVVTVPLGRERETKVLEDVLSQLPPRRVTALLIRYSDKLPPSPEFVRERTNRFRLYPVPLASSAEGDLYLPEDRIPAALAQLRGRTFNGVTLNAPPPPDPRQASLLEVPVAPLALPILSPHPVAARGEFGLNAGMADGRAAVLAHPISELQFNPPAGATQIEAEVGVVAAAYAPGVALATNGVSVEIYEIQPNGLRRVLYRRDLNPARVAADRGPQAIRLEQAGPFAGPVIFRITPGPRGTYNNDWAYWSRIAIH